MIVDLARSDGDREVSCDVCIIGAGAAGITLARELRRSRAEICLVEGGGLDFDDKSQALYAGDEIGAPSNLLGGRLRMFGGSTNHWGGRCGRLDPLDFAVRDWTPHSGWPIDAVTLAPYYDRALPVCGFVRPWPTDAATFEAMPAGFPRLGSPWIKPYLWRFTPQGDGIGLRFGVVYRRELSDAPNVRVVLNANHKRFEMTANGGRVMAAHFVSLSHRHLRVRAKTFVLSAGGIENPRLLLIGDGTRAIGNGHDVVGRFLAIHPRSTAATLFPSRSDTRLSDYFNWDVLRHRRTLDPTLPMTQVGLAISERSMLEKRLLNGSVTFDYTNEHPGADAPSSNAWPAQSGGAPWRLAREALSAPDFGARKLDEFLHGRKGPIAYINLIIDLEQRPSAQNRVSLSHDRDFLDLPRARVEWRFSEQERKTTRFLAAATASEFARLGLGRTRLEPWLDDPGAPLETAMTSSFHFSGTTRMGSDPQSSVVDADGKVHGLDNLYVAGSSVFPTNGHVNPTLTIVAMALRLSDRISARMASGAVPTAPNLAGRGLRVRTART